MKILLATLIALGSSAPLQAEEYQPGYTTIRTCTRSEYREEYVPGTQQNPGYVRSWTESVEVPCNSPGAVSVNRRVPVTEVDTNDCSQGTIIGGLLGAGLAGMGTRGKDRWLTVPAGGVAGAMIGCQVDGG